MKIIQKEQFNSIIKPHQKDVAESSTSTALALNMKKYSNFQIIGSIPIKLSPFMTPCINSSINLNNHPSKFSYHKFRNKKLKEPIQLSHHNKIPFRKTSSQEKKRKKTCSSLPIKDKLKRWKKCNLEQREFKTLNNLLVKSPNSKTKSNNYPQKNTLHQIKALVKLQVQKNPKLKDLKKRK